MAQPKELDVEFLRVNLWLPPFQAASPCDSQLGLARNVSIVSDVHGSVVPWRGTRGSSSPDHAARGGGKRLVWVGMGGRNERLLDQFLIQRFLQSMSMPWCFVID